MESWVILVIVAGLVIVLLLWFFGTYNGLVSLRNQVKNAWSQIDVQLKRRHDLIPNLVEACKGYMKFEQSTLEKVIQARNMAMSAQGVEQSAKAENMLTGALKSLFALVESYPDLKAQQNVGQLMEELASTENKISFARQFYNDSVMRYNTRIQQIPANIVAGMGNFTAEEFFEVESAEERIAPKVDLNIG
ncbi:MAG: LemA family protein [Candidatus Brocadiia bacterium]